MTPAHIGYGLLLLLAQARVDACQAQLQSYAATQQRIQGQQEAAVEAQAEVGDALCPSITSALCTPMHSHAVFRAPACCHVLPCIAMHPHVLPYTAIYAHALPCRLTAWSSGSVMCGLSCPHSSTRSLRRRQLWHSLMQAASRQEPQLRGACHR